MASGPVGRRLVTLVLAGDFGGTSARLALFEVAPGALPQLAQHGSYAARDVSGIDDAVARFLAEQGSPAVAAATFGVAGAVADNRALLTNLGWNADGAALGERFGFPVELVNDLVATALGMSALTKEDVVELNPDAAHEPGNAVLVGAGTGLGVALLVWSGQRVLAAPSEGGHAELAAHDEEEWALHEFLAARFGGRVSVERVVSGMGLRNLYDFLLDRREVAPSREVEASLAAGEDAGRAIAQAGLDKSCPLCVRVLDLFARAFGSYAGDLALIGGARGGVYLGGGVSERLADKLADGTFLRAFMNKGRLTDFVQTVPVQIILRPDTAIWGAARRAGELAAER
ncbi:MAG TPA: glucokinase [Thermoanaerobaculia bacterium]|nr:glucokinase [Thermoanaerobaculia bacterium]